MQFSKLLLAVVAATVVLGALASSATAGRLSFSGNAVNASWTRLTFSGGLTVECEVILNSTLHTRTITKTRGLLIGYITAGNVNRCPRNGATILRETLPWHVQYDSFTGTLPAIATIRTNVVGFSMRIREAAFGIECLMRSTATEPMIMVYTLTGNVVQSATVSGRMRCGSFEGSLSGTSSSITRVTVTLI